MSILYIHGCGGHARSIADTYLRIFPDKEIVFIDSNAKDGESILGFKLFKELSFSEELSNSELFIGIGDNLKRKEVYDNYFGKNIISIISSNCYISNFAKISRGCFIGNLAHIGVEAFIDENSIINTASIIEHGVRVGKHSHIAPNVAISGNSLIGSNVFVGTGSNIINNITVCDNVIIGAGTTVVKSITEPGLYVGSPARRIK